MYERGSHDWREGSYGSGAGHPGAPTGAVNGTVNGTGYPTAYATPAGAPVEEPHVWYRSPSGEPPPATTPVVDVTNYDTAVHPSVPDAPVYYPMRNTAGRAALWFGVLAILCSTLLFPLFPLALVFAIPAIVLGRRGRLRARYGFASNGGSASAAVALGTVAVVMATAFAALTAWLFVSYDLAAAQDCVTDSSRTSQAMRCLADVIDAG